MKEAARCDPMLGRPPGFADAFLAICRMWRKLAWWASMGPPYEWGLPNCAATFEACARLMISDALLI